MPDFAGCYDVISFAVLNISLARTPASEGALRQHTMPTTRDVCLLCAAANCSTQSLAFFRAEHSLGTHFCAVVLGCLTRVFCVIA